ncbi:DUF397 domain-containing protein [Streptomyces sp. CA-294286]|uniref:DUF397 domain-containing protein n=1 Tax=Streptomyces sp. CA-294286 TaxID=3240070 RepID=UPI003D942B85
MKHTDKPLADLGSLSWRRSSYSGNQGNCVEISGGLPTAVPVRDSKRPTGPALLFTPHAWAAFVADLKHSA